LRTLVVYAAQSALIVTNHTDFPTKKPLESAVFLILVEMAGIEPASESASTGTFSERILRFFPHRLRAVCLIRVSQARRGFGYPVNPLCYRELTQSFPAYLAPGSGSAGEPGLTSLCGNQAANARFVFVLPFIIKTLPLLT